MTKDAKPDDSRTRLIEMEALKVIDFALTLQHSIPALERALELIRGAEKPVKERSEP